MPCCRRSGSNIDSERNPASASTCAGSAPTIALTAASSAGTSALSGSSNPYPGKLGVVEEGALANLLQVDGDRIVDIRLIEDPAKNFVVIMKDGRIYKNTVRP